ncbi:hypothetical protein [Streptomyces lavendulae]|uniref:hypothetical protein n=1 Tax=Streptomyces lavendulae TaxID=1914 RepID=UPI0025551CD6|nr:hypothetical protein [Streptomyces lavendulae]
MAFALAATSSGYGREYIRTALLDPRNALGETFRARKSHWQDGEVERLWSLALSRQGTWSAPKISNRREALDRVASWNAALELDEWKGTAGSTDRAVCEALARLAHSQGGIDFSAGLSVVAVAAGVCDATARSSIKRIQQRGWLKMIEAHTPLTSTRYRLMVPALYSVAADRLAPRIPDEIDSTTGLPTESNQEDDLGSDIARWKAVGKASMLAWRALGTVEATSVESVAQVLKISYTAARLRLRKLQRYGLAATLDGLWVRACPDRSLLAEELGTSGSQERQARELVKRRHARKTLREIWSSAFRFMARSFADQDESCDRDELPDWIASTVPERVLSSWRARIGSPQRPHLVASH